MRVFERDVLQLPLADQTNLHVMAIACYLASRIVAANRLPISDRCLTLIVTEGAGNSRGGGNMAKTLSGVARRELIEVVRTRYRIGARAEK